MGLFERLFPVSPSERWARPQAVLPGAVGEELKLAHTGAAAVTITGLGAYPTGFEFSLRVMLRREKPFGRRIDTFVELHRPGGPDFLRLDVRFADGTMTTNLNQPAFVQPGADPAGPRLIENGALVDRRRFDVSYWVWRLPPPGPVTFICQWAACGIEDARTQLDGQRIRNAAARCIPLWPDDS